MYRQNRRVINSSAEPPPVVLAAQEETPAVPNVRGSQVSTPVGLTQQEGTPQQPSLPDPEVQTTPVRASTRLRRQPLWMADYDLCSLSLNNDHKLFDIVVVTVDHPS